MQILITGYLPFAHKMAAYLRVSNHYVQVTDRPSAALRATEADNFHLVLVVLPFRKQEADEFIHNLRTITATPVVVTTRQEHDTPGLHLRLLAAGADDYLVNQPLDIIGAHLDAVDRRARQPPLLVNNKLMFGDVVLDQNLHDAVIDGHHIPLKEKEYLLLEQFLQKPQTLLTRQSLFAALFAGVEKPPESIRLVDTYVGRLKRTIAISKRVEIKTSRGIGYGLKARQLHLPNLIS